jgi:hypothetical protein
VKQISGFAAGERKSAVIDLIEGLFTSQP